MSVSTIPTGYPPGWISDYDGETERWFYIHKPTGVRQYHFPKAGDEAQLAAALTRSKSNEKAKLDEINKITDSENSTTKQTQHPTPDLNIEHQNTSTASNITSVLAEQNARPSGQQLPTQQEATGTVSFSTLQNISNNPEQASLLARSNDKPGTQQFSMQHVSQATVAPLNTQQQNISVSDYQTPIAGHQIPNHVHSQPQTANTSPVLSLSNRSSSFPSSMGSQPSPVGHNASYFSDDSQNIASPLADEVLSTRVGVLSLPDHDRINMIHNLRNLARIYPDVTLSQFVNPYIDLPQPNHSGLSNLDSHLGNYSHYSTSSVHELPRRSSDTALVPSYANYDTDLGRATSISRDSVGPISSTRPPANPLIRRFRESLAPRRAQTSIPILGAVPSASAPSDGSALDFETSYRAAGDVLMNSIRNLQSMVQVPPDMAQALVVNLNQQGSVSAQITQESPVGTESIQLGNGPVTGSAIVEEPTLSRGMPTTEVATTAIQHQQPHVGMRTGQPHTADTRPRPTRVPRVQANAKDSWERTILEARALQEQSSDMAGQQQIEQRQETSQQGLVRKPLTKQVSNQPLPNRLPSSIVVSTLSPEPQQQMIQPQTNQNSNLYYEQGGYGDVDEDKDGLVYLQEDYGMDGAYGDGYIIGK